MHCSYRVLMSSYSSMWQARGKVLTLNLTYRLSKPTQLMTSETIGNLIVHSDHITIVKSIHPIAVVFEAWSSLWLEMQSTKQRTSVVNEHPNDCIHGVYLRHERLSNIPCNIPIRPPPDRMHVLISMGRNSFPAAAAVAS